MTVSNDSHTIPDAFDHLRAEYEERWFDKVFVPPADFNAISRMRSTLVFGEEGSGKTAIKTALIQQAQSQEGGPLVFEWVPGVPTNVPDAEFVHFFMGEVLNLSAEILLQRIGRNPTIFIDASGYAKEQIIWFLHTYLATDQDLILLKFENHFSKAGMETLKNIFERTHQATIINSTQPRIMAEVVFLFQNIGYSGIAILIDRLDTWFELEPERLSRLLNVFTSTVALFDIPGFVLKILCSENLKTAISTSIGVKKRRFDVYPLKWSSVSLVRLVELRLAGYLGVREIHIQELTSDPGIIKRLESFGGNSPRGWLEIIRPLAEKYILQGENKPLSIEETLVIYASYPPLLKINLQTDQVHIGYKLVDDISTSSIHLLRYLYTLPERSCTKAELYYKGLQALSYIPQIGDSRWEAPKNWNGAIDTALWRLRQAIESDPDKPIYIVSQRGRGIIKLENAW